MQTIKVHPRAFFILTYLLSWLIWIPLDLSHFAIGPFHISEDLSSILRLLGVLMPATAALILSSHAGGGAVRALLGRLMIWKVGWGWWGAALLVQPILLVVAGLVYNWVWGSSPVTLQVVETTAALAINIISWRLPPWARRSAGAGWLCGACSRGQVHSRPA